MKAIQYSRLGGPEVLQYVDLPDPIAKKGELLVRLHAAGFNHLDVHFRRGLPGLKTALPKIPGADGAGVVAAIGEGVEGFSIGDRVILSPGFGCGQCERCRTGETALCHRYQVVGRESNGTYCELIALPKERWIPLPDSISFETAAAAPLVYLTAWSMVVTKARVKPGDLVLVTGAGSGVGVATIQLSKLLGAKIFAVASSEEKVEKAKHLLGADVAFVAKPETLDTEIRNLTEKRGVDIVLDHVGGDLWVPLLRSIRNGGTLVTCGATAGFEPTEDLRQIFYRQIRVLGSTMGNEAELFNVLRLIFEEKLVPVIDTVFPLRDAAEAHKKIESRKVFGKVVFRI